MKHLKLAVFAFAVVTIIPAARAQVCTGNGEAAAYLLRSAPAALYQAGQISMAPSGLQEFLRRSAVAQVKAMVTWLEGCPGASPVTLSPASVCTYTTPSYFAQYALMAWTSYQQEGLDFAQEPETPLDAARVNEALSYLQQAYGLLTAG